LKDLADMPPTRAPTSVLLVEDDPVVRQTLADLLEDAGFAVTSANNRQQGAQLLGAGAFNLLITDLVLTDGNGTALIGAATARNIPSIGISGHPVQIDGGADASPMLLLAKPLQPDRLVAAAESLLGSRPAEP
jgi:DNA-binding NtrC family response regulator